MASSKNGRPVRTTGQTPEDRASVYEQQAPAAQTMPPAAELEARGAPNLEESAEDAYAPSYQERERGARRGEPTYDRTGDILRYAREQRRETLESIAETLRIRPSFLAALEACRYEDLPADAYVVGFLRSYAVYLGFEGKTAVDHYRREMAGRRRKPQLAMPQPVAESRAPTVAIVVAALAAALLIYAVWYIFSTSDRAAVSVPPPMPAAPVAEPVTPPVEVSPTNAPSAPEGAQPLPLGDSSAAPSPVAPPNQPQAQPQTQPQGQGTEGNVSGQAASLPRATDPQTALPTGAPSAGVPAPAPAQAPPAQSAALAASPQAQASTTEVPQSEPTKGRVLLTATADCWISVSAQDGHVLADKVLKAGESYTPPADSKGLSVTIGNVKGLDIFVDGVKLKRFSNDGRVLRGIPLDPDVLRKKADKQ